MGDLLLCYAHDRSSLPQSTKRPFKIEPLQQHERLGTSSDHKRVVTQAIRSTTQDASKLVIGKRNDGTDDMRILHTASNA